MGFKRQLNRLAKLLPCVVRGTCAGTWLCIVLIPGDNSCIVLFPVIEGGGRLDRDAPGRKVQPGLRNDRYKVSLTEHGERLKMPL